MIIPRDIYMLQNTVTGKIYVGSSKDARLRAYQHMVLLRNEEHIVEDMQADYNEYGDHFKLIILDQIDSFEEKEKEYEWMWRLGTDKRERGYNYKDTRIKKRSHSLRHAFKYKGKQLTIPELSKISSIPKGVIYNRLLSLGWNVEKAISTPVRPHCN